MQGLEPSEESKSFQTNQIHRLSASEVAKPVAKVADPSDDLAALKLWSNQLPASVVDSAPAAATTASAAKTQAATPATLSPTTVSAPTNVAGMHAAAAPFVEDDDDVETEQSYFLVNGPIVEDDDE